MVEEAEKIWTEKRKVTKIDIEEWRKYWKDAGPIRFAEEYLFCNPQVPPYPNWQEFQTEAYCEGCRKVHKKFHDNGIPYHNILSEDQKEVLMDAWKNGIRCILISAGRGGGKTYILAIWNTWRMCTEDYYEINSMGGSAKQSKLLQKYVDFWRIKHKEVRYIIHISKKAVGDRCCETKMGSITTFAACSEAAVRGPHVNEVQIDEACTAEAQGIEGQEATEAIDWEVTGRRDTYVWMTSTSHWLLGRFFEIYTEPEKFDFKRYIWSIAKHISGKPAYVMYQDKNPKHWKPAVWWVTETDIQKLRKRKSNEKWLCEALGRASLASGAIFKQTDLKVVICPLCDEEDCEPYKWGKCKLIEIFKLGDEENPTRFIVDRRSGFDYGDPAPCALIIGGRKGKRVFILYAGERKGMASKELIFWIDNKLTVWKTEEFNPDPSIGGKWVSELLDEKGYSIRMLDEGAKEERVQIVKNIVEKHNMIVPPAYWNLTRSMKVAHRDKRGKVAKYNDHSFDGLCYLCVDWGDLEGAIGDVFDVLAEATGTKLPESKEGEEELSEEEEFFGNKSRNLKFWED